MSDLGGIVPAVDCSPRRARGRGRQTQSSQRWALHLSPVSFCIAHFSLGVFCAQRVSRLVLCVLCAGAYRPLVPLLTLENRGECCRLIGLFCPLLSISFHYSNNPFAPPQPTHTAAMLLLPSTCSAHIDNF